MNNYLLRNIFELKKIIRQVKKANQTIGFVPTMGFLHQGHISLIRAARAENDVVIVSIFVNPTQFAPNEDLNKYPRDLNRDIEISKEEGVDYIFHPSAEEMYPEGFETIVSVTKLKSHLCGISRPTHFDGVTAVLAKLFNIVEPDNVYFGQKDAQQALIVKKMITDLNFPIKMHILPIVREKDGLAMSSRNKYLSSEERESALSLYQSLQLAKRMIANGENDAEEIKAKIRDVITSVPFTRIDYVEVVDYENLQPVRKIQPNTLIALAVYVGKTRLIDNIII
jgi:pantoate--beta-alanine ligase